MKITANNSRRAYSTEEAADVIRNRPATWRRSLCLKGHFMGIRPMAKLPNGRLLWPADEIDALVGVSQ